MAHTNLSWAIACFKEVERTELLLDKKRHTLGVSVALLSDKEKDEYVEKTQAIQKDYEGRRETARRKGEV